MKKIKYEDCLESLGLCECLIPLIKFEVRQGNKITRYDISDEELENLQGDFDKIIKQKNK